MFACNFELLRIFYYLDIKTMIAKTFNEKLIEIEEVLNLYKTFNLSLIGKVSVIKTVALINWFICLQYSQTLTIAHG